MKKISMIITALLLSSSLIIFTSCEDPVDPNPIDEDKPVVTNITASTDKIPVGSSVEVEVTAVDGNSYEWTAPSGSFSDPNSASTTWSSQGVGESSTIKLECKVTNSAGSRRASVSISVVVLTTPLSYWPLDTDLTDAVGSNDGIGELLTIVTEDPKVGAGCASFPGEEGGVLQVEGDGVPTDGSVDFTISLWIKTEQLGYSIYSRTQEGGLWDWEDGNKGWGIWDDYGYPANAFTSIEPWAPMWGEPEEEYWDGEWHHYAVVHFSADDTYAFYIDGELVNSGPLGYDNPTSSDFELLLTFGGNTWQQFLNGFMDDVKYYDVTLSEAEIGLIASQ